MKDESRILAYMENLEQQGIDRQDAVPPLYKYFWRLGVNISPPLNQSTRMIILTHIIFFLITMPILMFIFNWTGFASFEGGMILFVSIFSGGVSGYLGAKRIKKLGANINIPEL